jgi:hypothetical protein
MRDFSLPRLTEALCRPGDDPLLRSVLEIDDAKLHRLRLEAARLTSAYVSFKPYGVSFVFASTLFDSLSSEIQKTKKEVVMETIFLYQKGKDRYSEYKWDLPIGLRFGDTETETITRLGGPVDRGGGEYVAGLGNLPNWLKYDFGTCWVRPEFGKEGKLDQVVLQGYCYRRPSERGV